MDPKRAIKGTFCPVPWTGFIMNPTGKVKNCVLSNEQIGDINNESIENILAGDKNCEIKQAMYDNKEHINCSNCYKLERGTKGIANVRSDRYYYLKSLSGVSYDTYNTMDNKLLTVDMRWRNTCNLACVYCDSSLSSTWAKELNEEIIVDENALAHTKKYILDHAHELKNVYLAGGEPLLMKENSELLDKLNPNCTIRINTNLSNLKSHVFERVSKFKNVHWTVSVETTKEEFEYIRYGAKWETFLQNLEVIHKLDHKISFNMLWLILNPFSIFDTVDFFRSLGYVENSFVIGPITSPIAYDVRNANQQTVEKLKDTLRNRIQGANRMYLLHNSYVNMLKHIDEKFDKQSNNTIQRLEDMDKRRGLNYKNVFDINKYL